MNFHANGLWSSVAQLFVQHKRRRTASKVAKSFGISTFRWMIEK